MEKVIGLRRLERLQKRTAPTFCIFSFTEPLSRRNSRFTELHRKNITLMIFLPNTLSTAQIFLPKVQILASAIVQSAYRSFPSPRRCCCIRIGRKSRFSAHLVSTKLLKKNRTFVSFWLFIGKWVHRLRFRIDLLENSKVKTNGRLSLLISLLSTFNKANKAYSQKSFATNTFLKFF